MTINQVDVTADASEGEAVLSRLADEFAERLKAGEKPEIEVYASRHPAMSDEIRRTLRSVALLCSTPLQNAGEDESACPQQLGDYRILREVGRGGMGIVYEAEQLTLKRRVALKVLPFASVLDPKRLQRFKNEALVAAQLEHPHIVSVFGTGCDRGMHYFAMRFVEGRTLAELIAAFRHFEEKRKPEPTPPAAADLESAPDAARIETEIAAALSTDHSIASRTYFRSVARIGVEAAMALDHAHEHGILHRDIKPTNLLVDGSGSVWISDFGLAHVETDGNLTMTGDLVGTIRYMSPEQTLAQRVVLDHRTDIYSLGATLYELLTLEPAFAGDNRNDLIRKIAFEEPAPPRKLNAAVPSDLETIVLKCLSKNPSERYATSKELADDLSRFLDDQPIKARRPSAAQRLAKWSRRHRTVVATALTTLFIALVVASVLVWNERKATEIAYSNERKERQRAEENAKQADKDRRRAEEQRQEAEARRKEAVAERQRADELMHLAQKRERETRQHLYAAHIALAQTAWERNDIGRMVQLLEGQRPADKDEDLRGFEWRYLLNQTQAGKQQSYPSTSNVAEAAFAPKSRLLAIADDNGRATVWNVSTGERVQQYKFAPQLVSAMALSPDGSNLAVGLADQRDDNAGLAKVIDADTGIVLSEIRLQKEEVSALEFSPDGLTLAVGTSQYLFRAPSDGRVVLFEAITGKEVKVLNAKTKAASDLAFSPDGSLLAYCSGARLFGFGASTFGPADAIIWDVTTGKVISRIEFRDFCAAAMTFDADAKSMFVVGTKGAWRRYATDSWKELASAAIPSVEKIHEFAVSPDGDQLALACSDGTVRLWDLKTSGETKIIWHEGARWVGFNEDGSTLLTGGGKAVQMWQRQLLDAAANLNGHRDWVSGIVVAPDGQHAYSAGYDGAIRKWSLPARKEIARMQAPMTNPIASALASLTGKNNAKPNGARLMQLAISPDGSLLATGGEVLRLWNAASGKADVLEGHATWVMAVAFSPNGKTLASTDADGVLKLWDVARRSESASQQVYPAINPIGHVAPAGGTYHGSGNYLTTVLFTPDGAAIVVAGRHGVRRYDAKSLMELSGLDGGTSYHVHAAISPDGKTLATSGGWTLGIGSAAGGGGPDDAIALWDLATGKPKEKLRAYGLLVTKLGFSPDGKTLACAERDGRVRLWSVASGQELITLDSAQFPTSNRWGAVIGPSQKIVPYALAFSRNGQYLLVPGPGNVIRAWSGVGEK